MLIISKWGGKGLCDSWKRSNFADYKYDISSCLTFKCFIINDLFKRSGKHV